MLFTCTNTGNLGSYLTDTVSAYVTRDGGLTWEQVCSILCYVSRKMLFGHLKSSRHL